MIVAENLLIASTTDFEDDVAIEALIDALNEIEDIEDAREELFDHYANEVAWHLAAKW